MPIPHGTSFDLFLDFIFAPVLAGLLLFFFLRSGSRPPDEELKKVKNILLLLVSIAAAVLWLCAHLHLCSARHPDLALGLAALVNALNLWDIRRKRADSPLWKLTYFLCVFLLLFLVFSALT